MSHCSSLLAGGWDEEGGHALQCGCADCALHKGAWLRGQAGAESQPGLHSLGCVPKLSVQKGCLLKSHAKTAPGLQWGWGRGGHFCPVPLSQLQPLLVPTLKNKTHAYLVFQPFWPFGLSIPQTCHISSRFRPFEQVLSSARCLLSVFLCGLSLPLPPIHHEVLV